jgi:hypothetical protein
LGDKRVNIPFVYKDTELTKNQKYLKRFLDFAQNDKVELERMRTNKMPDVDLVNRHPALQSMCSKD